MDDAVGNVEEGHKRLRHRGKATRPAPEKEDGTGRIGRAYGTFRSHALESRARQAISHAADAVANRAGVQRRTGVFLFRRSKAAGGGHRATGRPPTFSRAARRTGYL